MRPRSIGPRSGAVRTPPGEAGSRPPRGTPDRCPASPTARPAAEPPGTNRCSRCVGAPRHALRDASRRCGPVAFVIVAFHRPERLADLLAQLATPGGAGVVVNVEADPEIAVVCRRAGVVHVPVSANIGYAAALNHGVRSTTADVIAFMNDDLV